MSAELGTDVPAHLLKLAIAFVLVLLVVKLEHGLLFRAILHPRLFGLISITFALCVAFAQVPSSRRSVPEFRAESDLVLIPASVTDRVGHSVVDLGVTNFVLLEEGKPQGIVSVSRSHAPISLGLIADASKSMKKVFLDVQEATRLLFADEEPGDEGFLIRFGDEPQLELGFTDETSQIPNKLASILPQGATALFDAIYLGVAQMRHTKAAHKVLVALTDCGDNHSRYSFSEVLLATRESGGQVYTDDFIGSGFDRSQGLTCWKLKQLAKETGGAVLMVYRKVQVRGEIARLNELIRNQYLIAYHPPMSFRDGKWHQVRVRVQNRPKASSYRIVAKSGYYAPAPRSAMREAVFVRYS